MKAVAALLEMAVNVTTACPKAGTVRETLKENLIEIALTEAADYDDNRDMILREHSSSKDIARPVTAGTAIMAYASCKRRSERPH